VISSPSSSVFILGTDTDVGKTHVATLLARGLSDLFPHVFYWKPVQTGNAAPDEAVLRRWGGDALTIRPTGWSYALPASPDQAAAHEGATAPAIPGILAEWPSDASQTITLVEGAGGLEVPLNEKNETWLDVLLATRCPVLLVARSGLGTLNHTALTLHRLKGHNLPVLGVVLNGEPHAANLRSLQRMFPDMAFLTLPPTDLATSDESPSEALRLGQFLLNAMQKHYDRTDSAPWLADDTAYCWHPYTQHRTQSPPLPLARAQGVWLETTDGTRLFDGTSSWWVNTVGHGRREIREAMAQQQARLDHVLFAGTAHAGAATLARRLLESIDGGFAKVFYSDNGSTAVEVALKMVVQYWHNRGQSQRTLLMDFAGSYHGDTFGAMAVGRSSGFHQAFEPLLFRTVTAPQVTHHPSAVCPRGIDALPERVRELEQLFAQHHTTLAGVIIEPWVQGASGMTMQPLLWLQKLAELCRHYKIPLIFDEVFTGMGRLGFMTGAQKADIVPDILCMAKGLTGGNLPLAITLAQAPIYEAFLAEDKSKALLHGHSYTANPIACAAALATLDIYAQDDVLTNCRRIEKAFLDWINSYSTSLCLANPRAMGGILAFELRDSGLGHYFSADATTIATAAQRFNLFLRPLGNTIYLVPPLTTSESELEWALHQLQKTIESLLR